MRFCGVAWCLRRSRRLAFGSIPRTTRVRGLVADLARCYQANLSRITDSHSCKALRVDKGIRARVRPEEGSLECCNSSSMCLELWSRALRRLPASCLRFGAEGLLLWAGLCFAGLAASNALVVADLFIVPEIDLYRWRLAVAAAAMLLLVYGLIFESDRS